MNDPKFIQSFDNGAGNMVHFADGQYIGTSFNTGNGIVNTFAANGSFAGTSYAGPDGIMTHFNGNGDYAGTSYSMDGITNHFGADGNFAGTSYDSGCGANTWLDNNDGDDPF